MSAEEALAQDKREEEALEKQTLYYPNNIGFTPLEQSNYEFVLMGLQNEKREAVPEILKIFEKQKASIVSLSFFGDQTPRQFVANVVADLSHAKCPPEDLLVRLSNLKNFVKSAEIAHANQKVCSSLLFPLTFFGTVRALAIDSDRFTRLFNRMCDELGEKAKQILFEEGRSEGQEIIKAIKNFFDDDKIPDRDSILSNAKAFLRSLGWGTIFFSRLSDPDIYRVTVLDPPTDADQEMAVCNYFLQGIVAGIIESLVGIEEGSRLAMMKESYDKETRALKIFYIEKSEKISSSDVPLAIKLQKAITSASPSKDEIARQVDLLIQSLDKIQNPAKKRKAFAKKKISSDNLEEILDEIENTAEIYVKE
jgi:hypothetical protein